MTASCPPMIKFQPLIAGKTLPGGKLYSYIAGTTTPLATYASDGITPNTNPIILDANGCCEFRLGGTQAYKFDLADADGVQPDGWPVDNILNPLLELASVSDASKGAGMVGYSDSLTYPEGSLGEKVAGILDGISGTGSASEGAGMVGYDPSLEYPADTVGGVAQRLDSQVYQMWETSGTAPAYTLSPSPALGALVDGKQYNIKVHGVGSGSAVTLTVSDMASAPLKQRGADGSVSDPVLVAGVSYRIRYDGTNWVIQDPMNIPAWVLRGFKAACSGSSSIVTMTADSVTLQDSHGSTRLLSDVSVSLNMASSGANGIDAGTVAISSWYYLFVIYNPATLTAAALCSESTTPTLPSGYTYYRRVGACRTDDTDAYPLSMVWRGCEAQIAPRAGSNVAEAVQMASGDQGSAGTPTWVALGVSDFVPPTATHIDCVLSRNDTPGTGGSSMLAPNDGYGAHNSAVNPPMFSTGATAAAATNMRCRVMLESTSVYYAANGGLHKELYCSGWVDSV